MAKSEYMVLNKHSSIRDGPKAERHKKKLEGEGAGAESQSNRKNKRVSGVNRKPFFRGRPRDPEYR